MEVGKIKVTSRNVFHGKIVLNNTYVFVKVLTVLFSFSLLRLLSFSLRVEHDGDKVAAAAADVDGDVPESDEGEIPAVYDQPGGGHGQAVRHLHQSRSIWSL